jgi:hypothetical protein
VRKSPGKPGAMCGAGCAVNRYNGVMNAAKAEVRKLLDALPEGATYEDIQYAIYVRQKIERGLRDLEERRVVGAAELLARSEGRVKPQ